MLHTTLPRLLFLYFTLTLVCSGAAATAPSLRLRLPDGREQYLSRLEELPTLLANYSMAGRLRLMMSGPHRLTQALRLQVKPGQRLVLQGETDGALELGELPQGAAALNLESGEFDVRDLTLRNGPAFSVQISQGVRYRLTGLRILDARGGGIAVWGPGGVDQQGPSGNRIEHCRIERFNTLGSKWTHDGLSVRDNGAVIARNIVRDSPTETMGIRVMGARNRVEGNLVQNVATGDAGGIYLWSGEAIYTAVGNVVRHNLVVGASRGIYLDDGTSAARVEQNYLIDCAGAALFIGGGRDNVLRENIAFRCPLLAHLDNRRTGWCDLPEKAALFAAARARLKTAVREEHLRAYIAAGGLDVNAFETLSEAAFNQPVGNRVVSNLLMPNGVELRWQNYANPDQPLVGNATEPAHPNRILPTPDTDWKKLSPSRLGIRGIPAVADLVNALSTP